MIEGALSTARARGGPCTIGLIRMRTARCDSTPNAKSIDSGCPLMTSIFSEQRVEKEANNSKLEETSPS